MYAHQWSLANVQHSLTAACEGVAHAHCAFFDGANPGDEQPEQGCGMMPDAGGSNTLASTVRHPKLALPSTASRISKTPPCAPSTATGPPPQRLFASRVAMAPPHGAVVSRSETLNLPPPRSMA